MNNFLERLKLFASRNRVQIITFGIIVALACLGAAISIYQSHRSSNPAVAACNLLTEDIAKELLGDKVIGVTSGEPTVENNVYTSQCSYTDSNPKTEDMKLAAVAVFSPRNAKGEEVIETTYKTAKSSSAVQAVRDVGDSAFFDKSIGQLNVMHDNILVKFSFGVGESIQEATVDDLLSFAKIILAEYDSKK